MVAVEIKDNKHVARKKRGDYGSQFASVPDGLLAFRQKCSILLVGELNFCPALLMRKRMDDIPTVSVPKFNRAARQATRLLCSAKKMVPVVRWIKTPAAIPACRRRCGLVRHLRAYATWLLGLAKDAGAHIPAGSVVHRKLMPLLQSDKIVIFLATGPALGLGFLVDVRVM